MHPIHQAAISSRMRRKRSPCRQCGQALRKGEKACRACGYRSDSQAHGAAATAPRLRDRLQAWLTQWAFWRPKDN